LRSASSLPAVLPEKMFAMCVARPTRVPTLSSVAWGAVAKPSNWAMREARACRISPARVKRGRNKKFESNEREGCYRYQPQKVLGRVGGWPIAANCSQP
jgi:hypothetical protein